MAAALLALAACHSAKSDFQLLCSAPFEAPVTDGDDGPAKAVKISKWIHENVTSPEVLAVLAALPKQPTAEKRAFLEAAAAKYGITHCVLAEDTWPASMEH